MTFIEPMRVWKRVDRLERCDWPKRGKLIRARYYKLKKKFVKILPKKTQCRKGTDYNRSQLTGHCSSLEGAVSISFPPGATTGRSEATGRVHTARNVELDLAIPRAALNLEKELYPTNKDYTLSCL